MTNPSLLKQVLLRHRSEGHLRFELPESLCTDAALGRLHQALLALQGVYRVDCYAAQRKLSVRYQEGVCSPRQVAARLRDEIAAIEASPEPARRSAAPQAHGHHAAREQAQHALTWLKAKTERLRSRAVDWRAKAAAFKSYAQVHAAHDPVLRHAMTLDERTVISFLVDITALYLVKVHWDLITKRWIQAPFAHRYEWLTIFFLVFLLVRFRKQPRQQ
jgi:hypothetical protein